MQLSEHGRAGWNGKRRVSVNYIGGTAAHMLERFGTVLYRRFRLQNKDIVCSILSPTNVLNAWQRLLMASFITTNGDI